VINAMANALYATATFGPPPSYASAMSVRLATIKTNVSFAAAKESQMLSTALSVHDSRKTAMAVQRSSILVALEPICSIKKRISGISDARCVPAEGSHHHGITSTSYSLNRCCRLNTSLDSPFSTSSKTKRLHFDRVSDPAFLCPQTASIRQPNDSSSLLTATIPQSAVFQTTSFSETELSKRGPFRPFNTRSILQLAVRQRTLLRGVDTTSYTVWKSMDLGLVHTQGIASTLCVNDNFFRLVWVTAYSSSISTLTYI
jgi:hypothetical protein